MRDRTDHAGSNPVTPSSVRSPPSSALSSQLHSPSLSRSPLLHSPEHEHEQSTTKATKQKTGHKITFSHTPPVVSAPPSQMHTPMVPGTPDRPVTMPPSGARTPMAYIRSRNLTPRFLTPLGSPLRKALHLTKLDPTDAWLPITESRNGNAYYAAFHTLCSGIGIQALVLPVAFTILGWAWGVIALTLAFIWQLYTLYLLVNLHESSETGVRYSRYMQLANAAFGERLGKMLALFPIMYLSAGTCMALLIIGGSTSKIFFQVVCAANECKAETLTTVEWYLVFTCGAVLLSQLPNLNSIAGISLVGAITAVGYCTLIWIISVSEGRLPNVSYNPVRVGSDVSKVFDVLNALGIISFAFRGHNLILEIQATMPSSEKHPSTVPMWKGVKVSYTLIAMCLFPLAIGGYWAYGQMIPPSGGMLTALFAYHSQDVAKSILALTSMLVIINALSSFQIYAMPIFDEMESVYVVRFKKPCPWWLRVIIRSFFGFFCFFLAVAIPFLASLAGLVGGVSLPVTLVYPCLMWLKVKKPKVYSPIWWFNWVLVAVGTVLSGLLIAAGVYVIIDNGIKFNFFEPE
ncbi:putative amino acid transporter, transmembrane domain-containing protein [Helianthus annuus]|uniref:Amino acid transporter, transmembrane domain-containing protein n=1 Tax=Helianthus annuus TaxID=4232 RepID=A0A251TJX6_HELAN|nr:lysine histidine transporter-like 8 [Helianthus annuus]KAF5786209.1 putative amino acid transporter, transmembrane domain-containing protein [Helianthus annuus]KAJ0513661.1 putative amino acid transporter, transmembrane domain-containing protein [Helianthus annuus]KAJ0521543.1 putative amino acid transporter, transmembrane domain-containing protein [Helianthus annuus]KAJ0529765.1 putative amino acid transporter, transmembrane domain-containing protein [Helianthus annuus]KAJ0696637.1 putativ